MKRSDSAAHKASAAKGPAEFLVDSDALLDAVQQTVAQHFRIIAEPATDRSIQYLDTFDWRLYQSGWTLCAVREQSDRKLVLATRTGEILLIAPVAHVPTFARDLPRGPLHDMISSPIEPRRLLVHADLKVHETVVRIVNTEEKTVLRVVLQARTLVRPDKARTKVPLPAVVRLVPVKGYRRARQTALALLKIQPGLSDVPECAFSSAMQAAGLEPGGYKARPAIALQPQMRGDDAMRAIHRSLLDTIVANADGVRQNLDPEFLHEYRVALRATRAALKQIKGIFPPARVRHFANEFKWLAAATGPVRDLDVYLIKMKEFRTELPEGMRAHLVPLEEYLRAHHAEALHQLVDILDSARYHKLIKDWTSFLSKRARTSASSCPDAARPVTELAADRIWRIYRRVWKQGRIIAPGTKAEALHALRIECKKLRYLLEFFTTLFPSDEMRALIKPLKQLQNTLGKFNDCEVQRLNLRRIANEMHQHGLGTTDTFLAMGRLMDQLSDEQTHERRRFQTRMDAFSRPDNRNRYRRLFKRSARQAQ